MAGVKITRTFAQRISNVVSFVESTGRGGPRSDRPSTATQQPTKYWVQAPAAGVPAATLASPGTATCDVLVRAQGSGTGYVADDLVKTGETVEILNYYFDIAGEDGDNRVSVTGHFDKAEVIGWSCTNEGSRSDIKSRA